MIIFNPFFWTGVQDSSAMNNEFEIIIIMVSLILTNFIGYKFFKKE
jgi:hypothetical protein